MHLWLLVLAVLAWASTGAVSFVYWWTKDYDFTNKQLITLLPAALCGPVAYFVGRSIHGPQRPPVTLVRRR